MLKNFLSCHETKLRKSSVAEREESHLLPPSAISKHTPKGCACYGHWWIAVVILIQARLKDVLGLGKRRYMCPWHFHELPNKDEFAAEGVICEIVTLPHYDNDKLIESLQSTESEHTVPTLAIIQKILPFQREAWGV